MYFVYSFLLAVGFVLAIPYYLWKGRATGKYLATFRERLGRLPADVRAGGPSIWIHAVSVGEVLAARTLIAPLRERFPGHRMLVSTTTVTGNAVARRSVKGIDGLFYAPYDWRDCVRRVLTRLQPSLLVLVETELWPNLVHEARARGTRVAVVNGRISPRAFPRYRRIRVVMKRVLADVDLFLMQGDSHARRVVDIGAPPGRVRVTGNLKFDALAEPRPSPELCRLLAADGRADHPLWVAGSTVAGEEEIVLRAFRHVRDRVAHASLIVAPRHPERFPEVPALVEAAGFPCVRRTELASGGWRDGEVLVLDTLGELAQVYPLATAVFVGGSLVPAGGHNILEPAVAGRAVVVGPHMENFQEIADTFRAEGALVEVRSAEDLGREVAALLVDEARRRELGDRARALIDRNRGALRATVDALAGLVA
jgi:3-deoxy-D-manno-octulosonic-acid transferase